MTDMQDRRFGYLSAQAIKTPVQIATDKNTVLRGHQTLKITTVTGVYEKLTEDGDRVLLINQDDPVENGIWLASHGWWKRAPDFNGSLDAVNGTLVSSIDGDIWRVITDASDIIIGATEINFKAVIGDGALRGQLASSDGADMIGFDNLNLGQALSTLPNTYKNVYDIFIIYGQSNAVGEGGINNEPF